MAEQTDFKRKEFLFRGKDFEELKQMDLREFAKLLKSREKRTLLKNSEKMQDFVLNCNRKAKRNKPIRTHLRHLIVVPKLVGLRIMIHNGKEFVPVKIEKEMLGHRLGEFSLTRNKVKHRAAGVGATRSSASRSVK